MPAIRFLILSFVKGLKNCQEYTIADTVTKNLFYNYLSFIYFLPTEAKSHEILVHGPDIFGRAHLTFCSTTGLLYITGTDSHL